MLFNNYHYVNAKDLKVSKIPLPMLKNPVQDREKVLNRMAFFLQVFLKLLLKYNICVEKSHIS